MSQNNITILLLLFTNFHLFVKEIQCCSSIGSNSAGKLADGMVNASHILSDEIDLTSKRLANTGAEFTEGMVGASKILSNELDLTSKRLEETAFYGVDAARDSVRNMSATVETLAKKVSVQVDSGDLQHFGQEAAQQLKEGLVGLSKNISVQVDSGDLQHIGQEAAQQLKEGLVGISKKLTMDTADLKDAGASAAMHLSEALQKVNINLTVKVEFAQEVVTSVKYVSIAIGGAFGVLFFSIVVCLGIRYSRWGDLKESSSSLSKNNSSKYSNYQTANLRQGEDVYIGNTNEKSFQQTQPICSNGLVYQPLLQNSQKDNNLRNNSNAMYYGTWDSSKRTV